MDLLHNLSFKIRVQQNPKYLNICTTLHDRNKAFTQLIKDPDTIVSQNQAFKLGFFTPENTTNRYLGIFHAFSEKKPVWIANRNRLLLDYSSTCWVLSHIGWGVRPCIYHGIRAGCLKLMCGPDSFRCNSFATCQG
ncbi:hypothetical protein ACS0TY_025946 [Phlomoides rotata]